MTEEFGLIAAPFTPMDDEGELKLDMIHRYARHLININMRGAFVCGTTGEGFSLTTGERKLVLEEWLKNANGELKIINHVGSNSLSESKDLAAHSEKTGAYAIAASAPTFFKPATAKELVDFLVPIAAAAPGLPFYFYHIPSLTGVNLSVSDIFATVDGQIPNFAGVKYTHFDLYDMQKCIAYKNGKYKVFHGFDETLVCGLSLGAKSAVGSTYNYISSVYFNLLEAFANNDMEKAREWQQNSVKIIDILNNYGGGVRGGKAIMSFIGLDCGPCRLPIKKLTESELISFKEALDDAGFFKFAKENIKGGVPYIP